MRTKTTLDLCTLCHNWHEPYATVEGLTGIFPVCAGCLPNPDDPYDVRRVRILCVSTSDEETRRAMKEAMPKLVAQYREVKGGDL